MTESASSLSQALAATYSDDVMNVFRRTFIKLHDLGYAYVSHHRLFHYSAQDAHNLILAWLEKADNAPFWLRAARWNHRLAYKRQQITVGGIQLDYPLILAAGFVKGEGFATESQAVQAVRAGRNIMPGWRVVPALVGPVEFGSFTRQPRIGNTGTVVWRDLAQTSTQNRIGLRNPGAVAAALFLGRRKKQLPRQFGINLAVSPGVVDEKQSITDILESAAAFLRAGVKPTWFTLNVSCPNTEDDPTGHQTETRTRRLAGMLVRFLNKNAPDIPLWVKISPELAPEQYAILMRVFAEVGVKAVIATNTVSRAIPGDPTVFAGVGGSRLMAHTMTAIAHLRLARMQNNYPVDIIGCGGLMTGDSLHNYHDLDIKVVQYWSALIFRGPLAAPIIESELRS